MLKAVTIRRTRSITKKIGDNYEKREADIAMTIESPMDFSLTQEEIEKTIEEVKLLVEKTLDSDPGWVQDSPHLTTTKQPIQTPVVAPQGSTTQPRAPKTPPSTYCTVHTIDMRERSGKFGPYWDHRKQNEQGIWMVCRGGGFIEKP